jgi:hypothetical protein
MFKDEVASFAPRFPDAVVKIASGSIVLQPLGGALAKLVP